MYCMYLTYGSLSSLLDCTVYENIITDLCRLIFGHSTEIEVGT